MINDYLDRIIQGNALEILKQLPDNIIDCIVTSPPYYSQRFYSGANTVWDGRNDCNHEWEYSYCKRCGAWLGQLGCEPTPDLYIEHLLQIFRECYRVLKPSGVFFLNIGDTYWGSHQGSNWLRPKQLLMIPYRLAIRMQDEGWLLRNIIIWYKPNAVPHPAADRLTSRYEPVFMFTKEEHYYFDLDAIRVPHKWAEKDKRSLLGRVPHRSEKAIETEEYSSSAVGYHPVGRSPGDVWNIDEMKKGWGTRKDFTYTGHGIKDYDIEGANDPSEIKRRIIESFLKDPKGRNPGDVWKINTASFKGAHTAVFPEELVERCLKVACPREVCSKCGRPKKRVYKIVEREWKDLTEEEKQYMMKVYGLTSDGKIVERPKDNEEIKKMRERLVKASMRRKEFLGWYPTCKCNAEFVPGIVLDPFIGSGTTGVVAKSLGLHFIGIEISPKYVQLANNRIKSTLGGYF